MQRIDSGASASSYIRTRFSLYEDSNWVGYAFHNYWTASSNFPVDGTWYRGNCLKLSKVWQNWHGTSLPDFDEVEIRFSIDYYGEAYFDNIRLYCPSAAAPAAEPEPEPWIRGDRHMVCSLVEVDENGCFEFTFIYEYADNNWVSIFNKDTKELVHQINMPYGKANFEACLENNTTYVVFTHRAPMSSYDELAEEDNHFQMFEVSNYTDSM